MEIKYKDFVITGDELNYTVTEYGTAGDKSKNEGEIVIKNQTFHPTIESSILKIAKNIKINKKETIQLENIVENLKNENISFLKELKYILNEK